MSREALAGGWWPDDWSASDEVEYPEGGCEIGPPEEERVRYEYEGTERCGWCGRPIDACLEDPCDHYREGVDGTGSPG